ncbi:MAG: oligosaccharide flippase family protein [Thermodesulfobacteriota bacterium]
MTATIPTTILRNAKFNLYGRLWSIALGLILTPYIVHRLGVELFGVWAIIMVITGFFGLLDCGAATSFIKFIAEFQAKNEHAKINQLINTGIIFYFLLSVLVLLLFTPCIRQIFAFLNIPLSATGEITRALYWAIATFCLNNIFSPLFSLQPGLQRMDISNKVNILFSIPSALGTVFFLEKGYGLLGLVYNNLVITFLTIALNCFIAYRIFPRLRLHPSLASIRMGKKIWGYGYKLQVAHISSQVSQQIDKVILSHFLSIGAVSFYQLGGFVIDHLRSLVLLIFTPIMPAFAKIEATGNREAFLYGYTLGTKYLAMLVMPLFAFIMITAPQLMAAWMGNGYGDSAFVVVILGLGYLFAVLSGLRSMALQATGQTHIEMWAGIMAMVLNVPLSLILVLLFGFYGVAIGTAVSLFFSAWYGIVAFHRTIDLPVGSFLKRTVLTTTIITVALACLLLLFTHILRPVLHPTDRWGNLLLLMAQALFFAMSYLTTLYFTKPLVYAEVAIFLDGKSPLAGNFIRRFSKNPSSQIAEGAS